MSAGRIELVLVDFDDTLVDTAPRFQNARRGLFSYLQAQGVAAADVARLYHDRVDERMLEKHGLGPARLEHSFRATYEEVCRELGISADPAIAEQCAQLGRGVVGTPPLFEGALRALERLARHHRTVLYTQASDLDYQMGCVRESGVLDILTPDAVYICARKDVAAFQAVLQKYDAAAEHTWMVGNSIRHDLNPALAAGANAILVEVADPWHFDMVEPIANTYVRRPSFHAAVDYLVGMSWKPATGL